MQTLLTSIYQTLNQNNDYVRDIHNIPLNDRFTPWNSLDIRNNEKNKSKNIMRNINSILKSNRIKNKTQSHTPSIKTQSIKRTSYCFQTDLDSKKDLFSTRRNSLGSNKFAQKLPQLSTRGQQRVKIKYYNDQQQLKKYETLSKLSSKQQDQLSDGYKTMFLSKLKNSVQLRNKNIQMIRHISQRKMGIL